MLTYEETYKIAAGLMSKINRCVEDELSFTFWYDWGELRFGGEGAPCVVLKENGRAVSMPIYVMQYGGGKKSLHKWSVDQDGNRKEELPLDEEYEEDDEEAYDDADYDDEYDEEVYNEES